MPWNPFSNQNSTCLDEINRKFEEIVKANEALARKNEEIVHKHEELEKKNEELQQANEELKKQNSSFQEKLDALEKKSEAQATEPHPATEPQSQETPSASPEPVAEASNMESATAEPQPSTAQPEANPQPIVAAMPQEVTDLLKKVDTHLAETAYKDGIIKDIHAELQEYKMGLRNEIVKPIMKDIILIYDSLKDTLDKHSSEDELQSPLRKECQNTLYSIEDLLYAYDIEPVKVNVGDPFDPKHQKAVDKRATDDESKDKTIAAVLKSGFVNTATGHLLRDPQVVVFVKSNNENN